MSGFLDIISVAVIILGILYMICCVNTLVKLRKNKVEKKELDKVYSYIIIIAILYIVFGLIKIKQ